MAPRGRREMKVPPTVAQFGKDRPQQPLPLSQTPALCRACSGCPGGIVLSCCDPDPAGESSVSHGKGHKWAALRGPCPYLGIEELPFYPTECPGAQKTILVPPFILVTLGSLWPGLVLFSE